MCSFGYIDCSLEKQKATKLHHFVIKTQLVDFRVITNNKLTFKFYSQKKWGKVGEIY